MKNSFGSLRLSSSSLSCCPSFRRIIRPQQKRLVVFIAFGLVGCGGGDDATAPAASLISGRIADGYLRGATIFWDCNNNMVLDADEPSTVSAAGGKYLIPEAPVAKAPLLTCSLRALVPAQAIDEDTGSPVGSAYVMSAVDGSPEFISPLTTLQNFGVFTEDELRAKFPATMTFSLKADYIAAGVSGEQAHNAAKFIALALQSVNGLISTNDPSVRKSVLERAVAFVPATAYTTLNASPVELANYVVVTPRLDLDINVATATLDKSQFMIMESAFSGSSDPRRSYVQLAVDAVGRHPEAVVGNTVYWKLIPAAERSLWGPQIVGGLNGFEDTEQVISIRTALLAARQRAANEVYAESNKITKQMATVLAKNAAEMALVSLDSAVKLLPAGEVVNNYISKVKVLRRLGVSNAAKLRILRTRAVTYLGRIEDFTSFAASCGGLAKDLSFVDEMDDFVDMSKVADVAISTSKCVAAITKSPRLTNVFELVSAGKGFGEGVAEGDLLALLKTLSDVTAALMDSAGMSVASAIYNESLGMFIASNYALNELNRKGNAATTDFEVNSKRILDSFNKIADDTSSALIGARLAPYIRPANLVNVQLPSAAVVGQPSLAQIDQSTIQPLVYKVSWGGSPVVSEIGNWSSSGGSVKIAATYSMPGTYSVTVEIYDNTNGEAPAPFQILSQSVEVSLDPRTVVTTVMPLKVFLGKPVLISVSGNYLPLTSTVSISDSFCRAPKDNSAMGFSVECTFGGSPGSRAVSVLTDRPENGGVVISSDFFASVGSKIGFGDGDFDWTKISSIGGDLPDTSSVWACVRDNRSGLVWEMKTSDGSIQDRSQVFGPYGYKPISGLVNKLNERGYCGRSNWRTPSRGEVLAMDVGVGGKYVSSSVFPDWQRGYYWLGSYYGGGPDRYAGHDVFDPDSGAVGYMWPITWESMSYVRLVSPSM